MKDDQSILDWDSTLPPALATIASELRSRIRKALPDAQSKLFHGAPVWFLDDNPLLGYSESKGVLALLFWSGKSFATPGLTPKGKHQAAEVRFATAAEVAASPLQAWLREALTVQWDYKNIRQNNGVLHRLA
jgi:hypothetical protein